VAGRIVSLAPRLFVTGLVASMLASATLTFAAVNGGKPVPLAKPAVPAKKKILRVPDVTGEAYVFAKGVLEDAGFAWRVQGAEGFAVNIVSAQSPRAGTPVVDTGAPTVVVTLSRNGKYRELGTPENSAPYAGTPILRPGQKLRSRARAKPKGAAKAAAPAPKRQKQAVSYGGGKLPNARPPAFRVAGAPPEPIDEMPLPDRARLLDSWLTKHPNKTQANVQHWLYQHNWLVYGARFGWWHGAEALGILVKIDHRVQSLWGVGAESEAEARRTLAEVRTRANRA
jgi:PASTA domain-containing protein